MTHSGESWRLGHRPALDGLRGIAILLVLAAHAGILDTERAGAGGVIVFFTLSGFLITTLLLEESDRTGGVSVGGFYRRRALRLLPALVVMVAVVSTINLALPGFTSPRMELGSLLYVGNWVRAFTGLGGDALGHTWSLSIEEQFYLVAPFLVIGLRRRPRVLMLVALALSAASLLERAFLWDGGQGHARIYNGTDTRLDSLLIGVAFAALLRVRPPAWSPRTGVAAGILGAVGLVWCLKPTGSMGTFIVAMPVLISVCTLALIVSALTASGVLGSLPMVWLGRRSYGVYLWHFPVLMLAFRADVTPAYAGAAGVVVAVGVAAASYRWVELPFLRLKTPRAGRALVPAPVVS